MATILIIDDEACIRKVLGHVLGRAGYTILEAVNGEEGVATYADRRPDLVLCDLVMPGIDGIAVLQRIKDLNPTAPVVTITGDSTTERAIRAMALGAAEYLVKPIDPDRAVRAVRQILDSVALTAATDDEPGLPEDVPLIGRTDVMVEVFKLIGRLAGQTTTVLVLGESGTGKELVARAVHTFGPRRDGPFVAVNCAAIPEALLESELFGHEKGAFTGADRRRPGKFEQADGGTLFLDEIGDTSPATQAKLLRVLQDQEFYRVGGVEPVRTTARVVAATNRDLRVDAIAGRFREDLYYRLGVVAIRLPPLRERKADIPLLAGHFLRRASRDLGRPVRGFAPAVLDRLSAYGWPGNVRELANVIHQAVLQSPGPTLMSDQFAGLVPVPDGALPVLFDVNMVRDHVVRRVRRGDQDVLAPLLTAYEQAVINAALTECGGNVSVAAKSLGIHRVTLKGKLTGAGLGDVQVTGVG